MTKSTNDPAALLLRSILALSRRLRAERPGTSLSVSGLSILGSLNRLGPLIATQLAAEERLQPQSLTRLVAALEQDRLITRTRSEVDRREITIAITTKGRKMLLNDMAARHAWLEITMATALTTTERQTLISAATIMLKLASYPSATDDEDSLKE
jgi:DNA-binding MarR family transcriptional regulator